jgi:hypothetical protein
MEPTIFCCWHGNTLLLLGTATRGPSNLLLLGMVTRGAGDLLLLGTATRGVALLQR